MPLYLKKGDITKVEADALVNAANTELAMGGGVCGAIFRAAGEAELTRACSRLGSCPTGRAVVTPAFRLPAQVIVHAVGPVYEDGCCGEEEELRSAYRSALSAALGYGCRSIAFPLISSGNFGYPADEALRVATDEIRSFLGGHDMTVYLVLLDTSVAARADGHLPAVKQYLDAHAQTSRAVPQTTPAASGPGSSASKADTDAASGGGVHSAAPDFATERPKRSVHLAAPAGVGHEPPVETEKAGESFPIVLQRLIGARSITDAEVCRRANLDRRQYAHLRSGVHARPAKPAVLALCLALELGPEEAGGLLHAAGYALSRSNRTDLIVRYYLEQGIFDAVAANSTLFALELPLLGA